MSSVRIHDVPCAIVPAGESWRVVRIDTGAKVAQAPQRFLAIARAALVLHTPRLPVITPKENRCEHSN